MSTVKLSELTQATSVNETDILILENTTKTQKATVSLLASKFSSIINIDNIKNRINNLESKITSKAEINHKHTTSDITDLNIPTVPTKLSQLTNDKNFVTSSEVDTKIANISTGGSVDLSNYYTKSETFSQTEVLQKINSVYESTLIPIIDLSFDSGTSYTIQAGKLYSFGKKTTLDIELQAPPSSRFINEYMCQFISGSTPTEFTYPDSVHFVQDVNIEANKLYQVSIINNVGVIGGADNE